MGKYFAYFPSKKNDNIVVSLVKVPVGFVSRAAHLLKSLTERPNVKQSSVGKFFVHPMQTISHSCPLFRREIILFAQFE